MDDKINKNTWVYVVVQDPGSNNEQFVGMVDKKTSKQYIPAFLKKDDATGWAYNLPDKGSSKYEVQAVIYEELCEQSAENNFEVSIMDQEKQ